MTPMSECCQAAYREGYRKGDDHSHNYFTPEEFADLTTYAGNRMRVRIICPLCDTPADTAIVDGHPDGTTTRHITYRHECQAVELLKLGFSLDQYRALMAGTLDRSTVDRIAKAMGLEINHSQLALRNLYQE